LSGTSAWRWSRFSVAPVFIFFSCGEDFPRSSLGPGLLELPISDCRFSIADERWKELPHHFFNRQSAIVNRLLKPLFSIKFALSTRISFVFRYIPA
jgi:hypothetical protein